MTKGTLKENEPHPCGIDALAWIKDRPISDLFRWREAFASAAIEGNRMAEVCGETLQRILDGQPVSDRYVLGLAWAMRYEKEK